MKIHAYMLTGVEGETISDLAQRLAWLKKMRVFLLAGRQYKGSSWNQVVSAHSRPEYLKTCPGAGNSPDYYNNQQLSENSHSGQAKALDGAQLYIALYPETQAK